MVNKIILLFALMLVSVFSFSQTTEEKLKKGLGTDYAVISQTNSDSLTYLAYLVQHGATTMQNVLQDKLADLDLVSELTYLDGSRPFQKSIRLSEFNRLLFPNPANDRFAKLYRIDGTNDVFVIRPLLEVQLEYQSTK